LMFLHEHWYGRHIGITQQAAKSTDLACACPTADQFYSMLSLPSITGKQTGPDRLVQPPQTVTEGCRAIKCNSRLVAVREGFGD
jgi:hypothetical protein